MQVRVTFRESAGPDQVPRTTVAAFTVGHSVLEIAQSRGIAINAPCGGRGSCGKCLVRVNGPAAESEADLRLLSEGMRAEGLRLACQLRPRLPLTVEVQNRFDIHGEPMVRVFNAGSRPSRVLLAVDLGSTSVQMRVLDAVDGRCAGEVSLLNRQVRRGHDVMTRMTYALRGPEARQELAEDARETLRMMCKAALASLCAPGARVKSWTVAANSVMTHLLWNAPIDTLAEAPYRPAFFESRQRAASELGLDGDHVRTLPLLGSFVGGDTSAAVLALGLDQDGPARMLIDIGTNTEVLLAHGSDLFACSTPAGPAFEGGNISVGMRAEPGAITGIEVVDGRIRAQTIGNVKAKGICGTGLISVIMSLVQAGHIARDGTMHSAEGTIALSRGVELMQADVRELQLAKGALRAATRVVLKEAGLRDRDLSALMLAGAFGGHLNPDLAMQARMLPNVEPSVVQAVGNASLEGAVMVACEPEQCLARLERVRQRLRHIELAMREDFQELFIKSLDF